MPPMAPPVVRNANVRADGPSTSWPNSTKVAAVIIPIGTEPLPADYDDLVDLLNESGRGVVGTPEMAIAQIERLQEKSGGFGCYLFLGADFADWRATRRNYELFAEAVMPHFTGQLEPVQTSYDLIMSGGSTYVDATLNAQFASIAQYQEERAGRTSPRPDRDQTAAGTSTLPAARAASMRAVVRRRVPKANRIRLPTTART